MSILFEGFPRILDRSALKPGRWFMAASNKGPLLCLCTDAEIEQGEIVLTFRTGHMDQLEFTPALKKEIGNPVTTIEDDIVFSPGEGAEKLRLLAPTRRPFPSGALLRLRNGEVGIGFGERLGGELMIISLASGLRTDGYELVYERWSLSLRRGTAESLVGHFKGLPRMSASG
jgi:hypothetical protein